MNSINNNNSLSVASFSVKHVDPLDTVAAQAVSFDFDEEFASEAPGFYFPTKVPGAQYKVCALFQRRQCFKGARCPFRHINERQVLCKHWLRGLCKRGENCEFAHEYDLNRMQECLFFKNTGQCFPEHDHQLLTNRGFLFLDELLSASCDSLRVATFDPRTNAIAFRTPRSLVVVDQPAELVEFSTDRTDDVSLVATAEHRMLVSDIKCSSWHKTAASTLVGETFRFLTAAAGGVATNEDAATYFSHLGFDSEQQMIAFLELYGLWVATDSVSDAESVTFALSHINDFQQFICERLSVLGLDANVDGTTVVVNNATLARGFVRTSRSRFGEWVWHLPLAPLRAMLRGVYAVQLSDDGIVAATIEFRDDLIRALFHAGLSATFSRLQASWLVTVESDSSVELGRDHARKCGKSTGRTWCVDMSSADGADDGFVVVRRAHRVSAKQYASLLAAEHELVGAREDGDLERIARASDAVRAASQPAVGPFNAIASEWVVLKSSRATIQGNCNNPDCLWKHVSPEDKERAAECQFYARGFCRHGPKCRNKHVKKVLCLDWLAGFCPQGPACEKAHPQIEMLQLQDGTARVRNTELPACVLCGTDGHVAQACPEAEARQEQLQVYGFQHQQQQHQQQQHQQQQQPYY